MLHHYTSFGTLELILKNRSIRFSRLDKFDDINEGNPVNDYPFGARNFASCWTGNDEESIPQWAMYGDLSRGVRFSLENDPFIWHRIDARWHEKFSFIDLKAPYSLSEMLTPGMILIPSVSMKETFCQPVRYVDNVDAARREHYSQINHGEIELIGQGHEIAFIKNRSWEFQNEYRYVLIAAPGPSVGYSGDPQAYLDAMKSWFRTPSGANYLTGAPEREYVDLKISTTALEKSEILVGPLAPEGTFEKVQALAAEYAPNAIIRRSALTGTMRPKP